MILKEHFPMNGGNLNGLIDLSHLHVIRGASRLVS